MALVTRDAAASVDTSTALLDKQIPDLLAGEDLDIAAPCYIKSDGLVYMSNGTAANAAAGVDGFAARTCKAGQPITLFGLGVRFRYSSGLTPGATLFVGTTKGRLDTAATTGDAVGVAKVINDTDIRVTRVT